MLKIKKGDTVKVLSGNDKKEKNPMVNRKMIYMVWEILALGVQQDVQVETSIK